jgi:hypothetical protein
VDVAAFGSVMVGPRSQVPIVTSTRDQLGEIVELDGKSVDDPQQLDRLEVRYGMSTSLPRGISAFLS